MMVPPKRSSVLLSKWNGRFADGIYVEKIERTTAISEIKIDFPRYRPNYRIRDKKMRWRICDRSYNLPIILRGIDAATSKT
jgi:hypothetical protein